jgi:hypothetical protein
LAEVSVKIGETAMIERLPIHDLGAHLEAARLKAIEELAAKDGALPQEALQGIAILQSVLTAVREEIEAHEVKICGGAERPLR